MNKYLRNGILIVTGGAIGSAVTFIFTKKYYDKKMDTELGSMREYCNELESKLVPQEIYDNFEERYIKPSKERLEQIVRDYTTDVKGFDGPLSLVEVDSDDIEEVFMEDTNKPVINPPYIIPPEDLGEIDDYDIRYLNYYANKVLTDEKDSPITKDYDDILGTGSLEMFGEYDDDVICVRDDTLGCDYEVTYIHSLYESWKD